MKTSVATLKENQMNKHLTKQIFGIPSVETATRIDDSDMTAGLEAAHYRCAERLRELENQFEVKASEIRAAYVRECRDVCEREGE